MAPQWIAYKFFDKDGNFQREDSYGGNAKQRRVAARKMARALAQQRGCAIVYKVRKWRKREACSQGYYTK